MLNVQTGDIFFTHSQSTLAKLIRWAQSDPGETDKAWANHVGIVVYPGDLRTNAYITEAVWKTRLGHLEMKEGMGVRVFSHVTAPAPEAIENFKEEVYARIGLKYGWWKLLGHLVDRTVFHGTKVVSKLFFVDKRPICSYYVAHMVYRHFGWDFGIDPDAADPDEMMDYCEEHHGEWRFVGEIEG